MLPQNPDRFAVESIHSRYEPTEKITAVFTTHLHNIAGEYTGKDDPVAMVRAQDIFPAPEEIVSPYALGHFVTDDARGSHGMPMMPVAINTAVAGTYCLLLVSCLAFSMDLQGGFSDQYVDLVGNGSRDETRHKVQRKADEGRRQGFIGPTTAEEAELAYPGVTEALKELAEEFSTDGRARSRRRLTAQAGERTRPGSDPGLMLSEDR